MGNRLCQRLAVVRQVEASGELLVVTDHGW